MKRELTNRMKTLALVGALSLISSNAMALLDINLDGSSQYDGWDDLTTARLGAGYAALPPGDPFRAAPWAGPLASNVAGSVGNATYNKVSGTGYAASSAVYTFGGATFEMASTSVIADLETVIFQIDLGEGFGFLTSTPVLNYNGGSQALAADYFVQTTGDFTFAFGGPPAPTTLFAYQWDLSGIVDPITSIDVNWATDQHATTYELALTTGDTFTVASAIPEPASGALLIGAASLLLMRRRRA